MDEVAEFEKPSSLPKMHKVSNMMMDTMPICASSICYSLKIGSSEIKKLRHPKVGRKLKNYIEEDESDISISKSNIVAFDESPQEISPKLKSKIDHIWDDIEIVDYERYLELLNAWYVRYKRLPRKQSELVLVGFESKFAALFGQNDFREEIKMLTLRLYVECDDPSILDANFLKYLKKTLNNQGFRDRVISYVKQLF